MAESILEELLETHNLDPNVREALMLKAEQEFRNGNEKKSVFYQIRSLCKIFEERYFEASPVDSITVQLEELRMEMNSWENEALKTNPLMQYAFQILQDEVGSKTIKNLIKENALNQKKLKENWDFLRDYKKPSNGLERVVEVCQEMPKEWTILQICKGFRPETSYSIYPKIHEADAPIYLTVLKHIRSDDYPQPVCVLLQDSNEMGLFRKFSIIVDKFKECIIVDSKDCESNEARAKYWEQLKIFDKNLQQVLTDLKNFIHPWEFLFKGRPKNTTESEKIFLEIDRFCSKWQVNDRERVLLSLAALSLRDLQTETIEEICLKLSKTRDECQSMYTLLHEMHLSALLRIDSDDCYPCILVLDEHLDHFFWEELNTHQEFSRVNSLQCLWRLYQYHKSQIKKGYFVQKVSKGACLLNPDGNLSKTEMRMKSFFHYWSPHWSINAAFKPSPDKFFNDFFKYSCYVYAGHGSGLQYINGRYIAKQRIESVVFLFGCDSSRLHSNGLYSELVGAHLYYQAAMCPTLIGTLMPALDARMDGVAAEILSRWITPHTLNIVPWNDIDINKWTKEGKIQNKKTDDDSTSYQTLKFSKNYQNASLCSVIARIHQRITEQKFYNTVPYVCRGLPAWNSNVKDINSI